MTLETAVFVYVAGAALVGLGVGFCVEEPDASAVGIAALCWPVPVVFLLGGVALMALGAMLALPGRWYRAARGR